MLCHGDERLRIYGASLAHSFAAVVIELARFQVFGAKVKAAAVLAAIWLASAHVRQPTVDLSTAPGIIAICWHAVADIAVPSAVETDGPAH
jgi:hypothetical protein